MSETIVGHYSKRYTVESGSAYVHLGGDRAVHAWEFVQAFDHQDDAVSFATQLAQDTEHVRVTDRGAVES